MDDNVAGPATAKPENIGDLRGYVNDATTNVGAAISDQDLSLGVGGGVFDLHGGAKASGLVSCDEL